MGLDAYFYRIPKGKKTTGALEFSDVYNAIVDNDWLYDSFVSLNDWAVQNDKTFANALYEAVQSFLSSECYERSRRSEVLYFRKFHYLLDYFSYGDNEYAKDMPVSREQCEELRQKALDCLNEIDAFIKRHKVTAPHDDDGVLMQLDDVPPFSKGEEKAINMASETVGKHFPHGYGDASLAKVYDLYKGMDSILKNTDWETEEVVFNADW